VFVVAATMAPREATGNYPDQFLTFDYEGSLPMGLAPPHDHDFMGGTNFGTMEVDDGTGVTPPGALNVETSSNSAANQSDQQHRSGLQMNASQVDPLSIDPSTSIDPSNAGYVDSRWSSVESALGVNPEYTEQQQQLQQLQQPASVDSSNAATNTMNMNDLNITGSPLSTGYTTLRTSFTATNSPLSRGSPSATTFDFFSQSRPRARNIQSVLDSLTSQDEGESNMLNDVSNDTIPSIERTFDSTTSVASLSPGISNEAMNRPTWSPSEHASLEETASNDNGNNIISSNASTVSSSASSDDTFRMIYRNSAFEVDDSGSHTNSPAPTHRYQPQDSTPASPNSIMLSFGPNTQVADLKYFAERGCVVALLQALNTPRLITLGTRMLADYAKLSHRRVAVASNRRILEFVQRTMLQNEQQDWLGREYAIETVRSLTATEESDRYIMKTYGMLNTLALVARGGPFVSHAETQENGAQVRCTIGLASEKARLHACIAIMNLSCGKANKIEIAKVPDVLEAMRDVMMNSTDETRLKATTCIKNLSNADANDAALLANPGLVEAIGHVAAVTCSSGATPCTTNACLALMNLSISKANKHRVYRTPGVMDALMVVLERTTAQGSSNEARVKACSALSNLAIGYDNKIPMFHHAGFVEAILKVIQSDTGEARTKACSILWSFAAEMKNQVPVVQRGDILPVLVRVAEEDGTTEARFKCVAALTLLAESLDNAIPLLEAGALHPLMDVLHDAGPDPTQWKGQTASWCVGFLMNIAQSDEAVPALRESGVVELLSPLLTLDHYQSLKAAMAVTFCCRYDEGDECYDLLRKTENVIPKIISLLHNTLSGRGGNGYKYGVFTLRSSVGCIAALASGPEFMKERIATGPVFESLLRVLTDFCVDGGTPGAIVGGGRDDALSATLAIRALQSLTGHLIPIAGSSALPFGQDMEDRLLIALESFERCYHPELKDQSRRLATDAKVRIEGGRQATRHGISSFNIVRETDGDFDASDMAFMASGCCAFESIPGLGEDFLHALRLPSLKEDSAFQLPPAVVSPSSVIEDESSGCSGQPIRTFLLADTKSGLRFVVPSDLSGGRAFHDTRVWCFRRGRFCSPGEDPDPNYMWTLELQAAYEEALAGHQDPSSVMMDWSHERERKF
jgi:hypothetical protein